MTYMTVNKFCIVCETRANNATCHVYCFVQYIRVHPQTVRALNVGEGRYSHTVHTCQLLTLCSQASQKEGCTHLTTSTSKNI